MTTYFAFKLAESTQQGIDELLKNLDNEVSTPQHELHSRLSVEITDEILKHCVEELIHRFQAGAEGAGVLTTLLNLLKSTAHVMVRQLVGKHGNDEVAKMAQYLRDRRVEANGNVLFGFEMSAEMAQSFRSIFAAIAAGDGEAHKEALHAAMLSFGDLGLIRFYDDFTAPMELGFIKRKASDLGRGTIHKGIHIAINKLIPQLRQRELEVHAGYYGSLMVDA